MIQIRRILAPIDFSEHAARALVYARELAAAFGARLELLHVIEEPTFPAFYNLGVDALYGERPELEEKSRQALRQWYEQGEGADVSVVFTVEKGPDADTILAVAEAHGADVIVLATHGLTGLRHLLLGTVAKKVIDDAPCPVFVVRAFGKDLLTANGSASEPHALSERP